MTVEIWLARWWDHPENFPEKIAVLLKTLRSFGIDTALKETEMSRRRARSFNTTTDNAELSVLSRTRSICRELCRRVTLQRRDLFHRHANAVTILLLWHRRVMISLLAVEGETDTSYKSFIKGLCFLT